MEAREALAAQLSVIANATRLALLDRLARPAFAPEIEEELGMTRQGLKRHLDQLIEAGLVEARASKRGVFPATEYLASAPGIFAFKEDVLSLATPPAAATTHDTVPATSPSGAQPPKGAGLVVVHGRRRGEWFPLDPARATTLGRDDANDIALPWDPFASARHALIDRDRATWRVRDIEARNGTFVDFQLLDRGATATLRAGSIIGIGRSLFVLRE